MKNIISEKYNIILILLLFVIPALTLNLSFRLIAEINHNYEKSEQKKNALKEAEILASEADFSSQYSNLFRQFLSQSKEIVVGNNSKISNELNIISEKIFKTNLPDNYKLYYFKITPVADKTELIYFIDDNKNLGKKALCNSFNCLYLINLYKNEKRDNNVKINQIEKLKKYSKTFFGEHTDVNYIAKEMRSISTLTNGINKNSWFIWDYYIGKDNNIYGIMLFCNDIENYSKYGREIAIKNIRNRGKAIGAFVPLYKDFDAPVIPEVLKKSNKFKKYSEKLTFNDLKQIDQWPPKNIKQGEILGNYEAYYYLERGASHIAVVLVKRIKEIIWPRWLVTINKLLLFIFIIISLYWLIFKRLPQVTLRIRFALSYFLASILPFSLICVTAYGYLIQYRNTSKNKAINDLQAVLKSFDLKKSDLIKKYRATFIKALNDSELNDIIQKKGVYCASAAQRIIDIFEPDRGKDLKKSRDLPILGVKFLDENGEGDFLYGSAPTDVDVKSCMEAFEATLVKVLKSRLEQYEYKEENAVKNISKKDDIKNNENFEKNLASSGFKALMGGADLASGISKHTSIPIPRKNGDFLTYQIFDFINIDNKPKYIIYVLWDNQTLDDIVIKKAFLEYNASQKNLEHNFLAYKIYGQDVKEIASNTRDINEDIINKTRELARFSFNVKKSEIYSDDKNIFVSMPSLNFNKTVFVGWISIFDINASTEIRKLIMQSLVLFSIAILWICSLRSVAVFLKPVSSLKKALDEVSIGNYNIGFNDIPEDELGNLSNEFSNMIDGLREKERISKLISEQAVKALEKNSSGVLNKTETFEGVALVSDIRNFTGMSEKYEPTLITDLLNEHFAEMTKIISDNGGYIYKFIGDAIEAVFQENNEFEKSAYERAFNAGCLMIAKLIDINKRRTKNNLFNYKIGVGLCSGEMYSGSVGSLETRLDYAVLGDPLKKAAKFEALSIQNPLFPLVIDKAILEKNSMFGYKFKELDSKGQDFSVFSLDENIDIIIKKLLGDNSVLFGNYNYSNKSQISYLKTEELEENKISYFSLNKEKNDRKWLNILYSGLITIILSSLITFAFYSVYVTSFKAYKEDSTKECSRLIEQLQCDDVFKTSFDALCFDFYDDLYEMIEKDDTNNFNEKIKIICEKYKKNSLPIPKLCCFLFKSGNLGKKYYKGNKNHYIEGCYNHGFKKDTFEKLTDYAISERLRDYEAKDLYFKKLMGNNVNVYYMRSFFYRQSGKTSLDDEELLFNTNKIMDKSRDNFKIFAFCAIPTNLEEKCLIEYYKLLAGKEILLTFNKGDIWHFSNQLSNNQKNMLKQYSNNREILEENGYSIDKIKIGEANWNVFCISKDLASKDISLLEYNCRVFFISLIFVGFIIYFIRQKGSLLFNSINSKLKIYILSSAILPLLTVISLSCLYLKENYNVRKSDLRYELNQLMNDIERRELYFQPFCEYFLKKMSNEYLPNILKDNDKDVTTNFVKENITEKKLFNDENSKNSINPHFFVRETIITGREYDLSVRHENDILTDFSQFGNILNLFNKSVFFKADSTKVIGDVKGEMASEKILDLLASYFGNDFAIKLVNFPNHLICVSASFSIVGIYIAPIPNNRNPSHIALYLVFFDNELRPYLCKTHNIGDYSRNFIYKDISEFEKSEYYPFEKRYKSTLNAGKLFCFTSPVVNVGEYFFYEHGNDNLFNKREDLKVVKELGLGSSWLNTSYSAISRKIDLYGPSYLEMKRGDFIYDNIYAALASEQPINVDYNNNTYILISFITLSIVIIFFIINVVTSDLLEPVKLLMIGAKLAFKSDYSFRIISDRNDELGVLCDSFNKMMKGLEEKLLMNRMVSKTALSVTANIKDFSSKKENVFLLYVTVPKFDKIMKENSTLELFGKLRNQISTIAKIILGNGGDIDKIMGEKLLIVFHLNEKRLEDVAYAACNAAKCIENNENLDFKVSVGVNYGQVISGFLGVGEKRDFTVIGDPVNVTARIAVFAEKLESSRRIVSEQVMKIAKNNVKMEEYGEILFKGKSLPSKVYRIV